MRIIGGQWKGRRLQIPSSGRWPVRPTTDFAREALFNILDNRVDYEQISALDLFGGTGIHAIELASRGCKDITYVERFPASVKFVQQLCQEWSLPIVVVRHDVFRFIQQTDRTWDYIFADPPYDLQEVTGLPAQIQAAKMLAPEGFLVLEHRSSISFAGHQGFVESRHYGQTVFSFFGAGS